MMETGNEKTAKEKRREFDRDEGVGFLTPEEEDGTDLVEWVSGLADFIGEVSVLAGMSDGVDLTLSGTLTSVITRCGKDGRS